MGKVTEINLTFDDCFEYKKTNLMAEENPKDPKVAGENRESAPRREDTARKTSPEGASKFMKDKRKRTRVSGKNYEAVPRESRPRRDDSGNGERRSFNPNFTKDNKPAFKEHRDNDRKGGYGTRDDRPRKQFSNDDKWNRTDYDPSKDRTGRGDRDRKPYRKDSGDRRFPRDGGGKQYGHDKGRNQKSYGKKKEFTPRDYGENYPKFPAPKIEKEMRLNRYIAMSGVSSRREADEFIKSGQVSVNGVVVTELGTKIKPGDEVRFNDKVLRGEKKVYIVMNKPKGYVTTLEDPHAEKTVMTLLENVVTERVYPVGRLDKNSLGVLLITNDGDLTTRLTHPSYNKKKIYHVTLDKPLTRADMEQLADGITLEDGEIHADEVSYVKENKREIGIEIHSGRNRIVRRMFEHLGYKVTKLDRVYFAGLTKKNLKRGAWRFLTPREVDTLMSGKYE